MIDVLRVRTIVGNRVGVSIAVDTAVGVDLVVVIVAGIAARGEERLRR